MESLRQYYFSLLFSGLANYFTIIDICTFVLTIFGGVISLFHPRWYTKLWTNIQNRLQRHYPNWRGIVKHLSWIAPLTLFTLIAIITTSILMPINIWNHEQTQLITLNTKINDLQKQLSSITSLSFIQMPTTDVHINAPDTAEITITVTPAFNPAYSGIIPYLIENNDLYNHVRQFVRVDLSPSDFMFTYIDPSMLPENVVVVNKYSGTGEVIIMINDIEPGGKKTIDLPIYTMNQDPKIRNTEKLNTEILYKGIVP
jgi:hypothetical protein